MIYLVFDIGGSAIKYALISEKANILEKYQIPTPLDSIENFIRVIGSIFDRYKDRIQGMSLSLPGRIDSERGYTYTGGYLEYNVGREIVSLLEERCPIPISIENDGKCAALAEAWIGSLSDCSNGIVVVLGTGVGGGIIIDKKLYKGSHFQAGEFSDIITNSEAYAGESEYRWCYYGGALGLCKSVAKVKNLPMEEVNGYEVFKLANQGDGQVLYILDAFCRKLVIQLFNLNFIFDPERIAIGGGISKQDLLFKYIHLNVDKFARAVPQGFVIPKIVRCKFGNDSNLIGALYCFLTKHGYLAEDNIKQ